jgi:hypothetical protein
MCHPQNVLPIGKFVLALQYPFEAASNRNGFVDIALHLITLDKLA